MWAGRRLPSGLTHTDLQQDSPGFSRPSLLPDLSWKPQIRNSLQHTPGAPRRYAVCGSGCLWVCKCSHLRLHERKINQTTKHRGLSVYHQSYFNCAGYEVSEANDPLDSVIQTLSLRLYYFEGACLQIHLYLGGNYWQTYRKIGPLVAWREGN